MSAHQANAPLSPSKTHKEKHHHAKEVAQFSVWQSDMRPSSMLLLWPTILVSECLNYDARDASFSLQVTFGTKCKWNVTRRLKDIANLYSALGQLDKRTTSRIHCPTICYNISYGINAVGDTLCKQKINTFLQAMMVAVDWTLFKPLRHFLGVGKCPMYRGAIRGFDIFKAKIRSLKCEGFKLQGYLQGIILEKAVERHTRFEKQFPNLWIVAQACSQIKCAHYTAILSVHRLMTELSTLLPAELVAVNIMLGKRVDVVIAHGPTIGTLSLCASDQTQIPQLPPRFIFKHERLVADGRVMLQKDNRRLEQQLGADVWRLDYAMQLPHHHHHHHHHHHSHGHRHHSHHHHRHHISTSHIKPSESEKMLEDCLMHIAASVCDQLVTSFGYFEVMKLLAAATTSTTTNDK